MPLDQLQPGDRYASLVFELSEYIDYEFILFKQKILINKKEIQRIVVRVLWFTASALSFAVLVIWLSFYLFDSPREKMLQRENNELKKALKEVNEKMNLVNLV